jgi:hypothetical protein
MTKPTEQADPKQAAVLAALAFVLKRKRKAARKRPK